MRTPEMQRLLSNREHEHLRHDLSEEQVVYERGRAVIRRACSCGHLIVTERGPADDAQLKLAAGEWAKFPRVNV